MKKIHSILIFILVILFAILGCSLYLIRYQGGMLYFLGDNASGSKEAKAFEGLSTEKLIEIIDSNKNFSKYLSGHVTGYLKSGRYGGAIEVLGARTDSQAMSELTKIISTHLIGGRNKAIGSIGRHKNRAMVPILCNTLKKHIHWHTDILIIDALVKIDDPSALQCLVEEKDKIESADARKKAEKAIEKWSKESK